MDPEASLEPESPGLLLQGIDSVVQLAEKNYLERWRLSVELSIAAVIRGPAREVRSISECRDREDTHMSIPFEKVLAIRSSQSLML